MKAFKVIAGVIVAVATVVAVNSASASATAATPLCKVKPVHMSQWQKSFKFSGDKVTATFTLEGDKNCKYDMTLASFESESPSLQPVKDQTLYSYASGRFGKGTHTLTTKAPKCQFQLDIYTGKPLPLDTAKKGTRINDFVNTGSFSNLDKWHTDGNTARLIDFYENKTKCDKPEEPKDVCPNIDGKQGEVPEGHEVDGKGNCVVPEEPETPEKPNKPEVKGETTPAKLPETGAGAVAVFAGVTTLSGAAHAAIRRFLRK